MEGLDVVIVTWNSAETIRRCLESVGGLRGETHVVVVDNASEDETLAIVAELEPDRLIRNTSNLGFAAAANQGIDAGEAPWVLLLNPDAAVAEDYAEKLVAVMTPRDDVGMATGLLLRGRGASIEATNVVDSRGIRMTRSGRHLDIDAETIVRPFPAIEEVFGVSGAAPVYRRRFLDDVRVDGEIFDSDFFTYREDADLSWRGRIFGWRAVSVASAVATHVRRVTPERRRRLPAFVNCHSVKNRFLLRIKNAGRTLLLLHLPWTLARDVVVFVATVFVERSSLAAWSWLWRNRRKVLGKRREIQARRRLDDLAIAHWFG